jgi:tetratricopeptide (TPR) repeat protein
MGRYAEAIEAYQENQLRFPRTPDAGSALIPLARCFMALGPEHFDQAEKTLRLILDDSPIFTPQAPEFADALFLLGDMLSRRGRFEEAIPRLKEALHRYPRDRRTLRAEFLLADAYRQSGLALRDDLADPRFLGERERLKSEHVRRLREAVERFSRLVLRFESEEESELDPLEALYLSYARLYEADCWYELGQLDAALQAYERAAWIHRSTPSALAAYVQIINCHRCQGQAERARSALRRAEYLLKTMPEAEFADGALTGTRSEWSQYFKWLDQSDLF